MSKITVFPPEGCTYRVDYGKDEHRWFADEHEVMAWFKIEEQAGQFDPMHPEDGYKIFCETPDGSMAIDYRHYRFTHARLWGRRELDLGRRSTPGSSKPL